jgi:hypothetical protein
VLARSLGKKWDQRRREVLNKFVNFFQADGISEDELSIVMKLTNRAWAALDLEEREMSRSLLAVLDGKLTAVKFFTSVAPSREKVAGEAVIKLPKPLGGGLPKRKIKAFIVIGGILCFVIVIFLGIASLIQPTVVVQPTTSATSPQSSGAVPQFNPDGSLNCLRDAKTHTFEYCK